MQQPSPLPSFQGSEDTWVLEPYRRGAFDEGLERLTALYQERIARLVRKHAHTMSGASDSLLDMEGLQNAMLLEVHLALEGCADEVRHLPRIVATIVRRRTCDAKRKCARIRSREILVGPRGPDESDRGPGLEERFKDPDLSEDAVLAELAQQKAVMALEHCYQQLKNDRLRRVVRMVSEGHTFAEAARALELKLQGAAGLWYRALEKLRKCFRGRGYAI